MKAPDILREAAALIEQPGRWSKGFYALYADGGACDPLDPEAVCWCALGAIVKVAGTDRYEQRGGGGLSEYAIATEAFVREIGAFPGNFNDTAASVEVVTEKMRAAADKLAA